MSLNYTDNKNILIEANESCRVPIPVDRCSLEQICDARAAEVAENLERGMLLLSLCVHSMNLFSQTQSCVFARKFFPSAMH